jgi:hypothetical protein
MISTTRSVFAALREKRFFDLSDFQNLTGLFNSTSSGLQPGELKNQCCWSPTNNSEKNVKASDN